MELTSFFTLDIVIEYVKCLEKYCSHYSSSLDTQYFQDLISEIQLKSAAHLIEQQWEDVFKKEDGYKVFLEIFYKIFTACINLHRDKFFCKLKDTDILCQVVEGTGYDTDRFIPLPSKTNNRWNPPGKQYYTCHLIIRKYLTATSYH